MSTPKLSSSKKGHIYHTPTAACLITSARFIKDRDKLFVQTAASFNQRFNIDVRTLTEVIAIDAKAKLLLPKNQATGEVYKEQYDKLVLSPGAEPIRPPLPGISSEGIFTLRMLPIQILLKAILNNARLKGCNYWRWLYCIEMGENLCEIGLDVTIVKWADKYWLPLIIQLPLLSNNTSAQKELNWY